MTTKIKSLSVTFSEYKQIRKTYLYHISHCQSLIQLDQRLGASEVLNVLEKRYKSHTATKRDIAALYYIIDNYNILRYRLTWY